MAKINTNPEVRFAGFREDWIQTELKEIYNFQYGIFNNNPSNGGLYPVYGANGVIGGYTEYNSEDSVVIGHMGEYAGIVLWAEGKHFVTYNGIITKPKTDSLFPKFGYFLLSKLDLRRICDGSGQPFLSYSILNKIKSAFPKSKDEQKLISNFLSNIDKLITEHQQKHSKLRALKQAMLDKMFPKQGQLVPEIRFKGFEGAWVKFSISDFANRFDNLRIPIKAEKRVSGTTPYYGANGIQDYVEGYTHEGEFILIAEDGANDLINYPILYTNGKIWVNNHTHVLQAKKDIAINLFLKYAISKTKIEPFLVGGGRAKLNSETMMKIEVNITQDLNEQFKIAEYFSNIEDLIINHETQITKLQNIKKAFLAKMFI